MGTYFRWFWRQLTSMRVALILLLLLALASIPGSLLPQRGADPNGVIQFQKDSPELFAILDAFPIQGFDVYGSVWFSAVYLLLFVSLIGCIVPRVGQHVRALRSAPPNTPRRLDRMPAYARIVVENEQAQQAQKRAFAQQAIENALTLLRARTYRARIDESMLRETARAPRTPTWSLSVTAERGYMRETGNLIFHISLLAVLVGIVIGGGQLFNGQRALVEGQTLVNAPIDYDTYKTGRFFNESSLEPFRVTLEKLEVEYYAPGEENIRAIGQVRDYRAKVRVTEADGREHDDQIRVNEPLRTAPLPVYLIANGYAPHITVRNPQGETVFSEPVIFLPQDANLTSLGVVKLSDGLSQQVGLRGFFYPTKADLTTGAYTSTYPDLENPLLTLDVFVGDLGLNASAPQSVYVLETGKMRQLTGRGTQQASLELQLGQTVQLPDGLGTVTFEAVPRYASFEVNQNIAQLWVLVWALVGLIALAISLFVPRRRAWVKVSAHPVGVVIEYAALARGDDPTLQQAVDQLRVKHRDMLGV